MSYINKNPSAPYPLTPDDRERIRLTLAEECGYYNEKSLAELGTLLPKSRYGYSKLSSFAKNELNNVVEITKKELGGHLHEFFFVVPSNSHDNIDKSLSKRDAKLFLGKILRIDMTAEGSDYGVIDVSDNDLIERDSLIFYDTGVRNDGVVTDFQVGDLVEYGIFETRNGKKRGTLVASYSSEQLISPTTKVSRPQLSFKEFVYIPPSVFDKISSVVSADELPSTTDKIQRNKALFAKMAMHYDTLKDEEINIAADNQSVSFNSGLIAFDGTPIMLSCVKSNDVQQRVAWHCKNAAVNSDPITSITALIQLNWYGIEEDLSALSSEAEESSHESIIGQIERMFLTRKQDAVWLDQGVECNEHEADALYIPTGFHADKTGTPDRELFMYCKRGGDFHRPWSYKTSVYENAPLECYAKSSWLSSWATLTKEDQSLDDVYRSLAQQTLEEPWGFKNGKEFEILDNYLKYTFVHQYLSNCIGYSPDKQYAAFNTGLPDRGTYEYIYAFFERCVENTKETHPLHHQSAYKLISFTRAGAGYHGKTMSQNIIPLPHAPKYFDSRSATVWNLDFNDRDLNYRPQFDDEHILIVRCDRIPLDFYRDVARYSPALESVLENKELSDWEKYSRIKELLLPVRKHSASDEINSVYQKLHQNLKSCIELTIKKLSWNWRAVVPSFNPARNEPGFLLPISFCSAKGPDRALVATVQESDGEYVCTIHTVISLPWAYRDARLVCRPETEWLGLDLNLNGIARL